MMTDRLVESELPVVTFSLMLLLTEMVWCVLLLSQAHGSLPVTQWTTGTAWVDALTVLRSEQRNGPLHLPHLLEDSHSSVSYILPRQKFRESFFHRWPNNISLLKGNTFLGGKVFLLGFFFPLRVTPAPWKYASVLPIHRTIPDMPECQY